MPYLLHIYADGEPVGYSVVSGGYTPAAGEVVVSEKPAEGEVWDAAALALRPKTAAELLEEAKRQKVDEFAVRAKEELSPLFTEDHGEDETLFLTLGHLLGVLDNQQAQVDPRLREVVSVGTKALSKKEAIEQAATLEELEAIEWEG